MRKRGGGEGAAEQNYKNVNPQVPNAWRNIPFQNISRTGLSRLYHNIVFYSAQTNYSETIPTKLQRNILRSAILMKINCFRDDKN